MEPPPVFQGDLYGAESLPSMPLSLRDAVDQFEHVAAHEDALIAGADARPARAQVHHPFDQAKHRPIIVEAEAEVATRQEAVIVAQAQIATSEDTLRTLVFDPAMPDFWTLHIETSDLPPFQPGTVNVEAAVRSALDRRTDLVRTKKSLEVTDINVRYQRNQTLPQMDAQFNYGLQGLGGTQFERGAGFPGPIIGQTQRGFGSVLGDLFANDFPNWTAQLTISYPLGTSAQEANVARARIQQFQNAQVHFVNPAPALGQCVQEFFGFHQTAFSSRTNSSRWRGSANRDRAARSAGDTAVRTKSVRLSV